MSFGLTPSDSLDRIRNTNGPKERAFMVNASILEYKILMNKVTYDKSGSYLKNLKVGKVEPGGYLYRRLGNSDISELTTEDFIETLVRTRKPQI